MLILALMFFIGFWILAYINDWDMAEFIFGFLTIVCLISLIGTTICYLQLSPINEQIALCEEQNKDIESKISIVIDNYKEYESNIFSELKPDAKVMLASTIYPEIKTNAIIQNQIEIYQKNNDKIYKLKSQKIKKKIYAWWLFFGNK